MDEQLVVYAAIGALGFGLGWLVAVNQWKLRRIGRRIWSWRPGRCAVCKRWRAYRVLLLAHHRTAGWVYLCPHCYAELYTPAQAQAKQEGDQ